MQTIIDFLNAHPGFTPFVIPVLTALLSLVFKLMEDKFPKAAAVAKFMNLEADTIVAAFKKAWPKTLPPLPVFLFMPFFLAGCTWQDAKHAVVDIAGAVCQQAEKLSDSPTVAMVCKIVDAGSAVIGNTGTGPGPVSEPYESRPFEVSVPKEDLEEFCRVNTCQ